METQFFVSKYACTKGIIECFGEPGIIAGSMRATRPQQVYFRKGEWSPTLNGAQRQAKERLRRRLRSLRRSAADLKSRLAEGCPVCYLPTDPSSESSPTDPAAQTSSSP